MKTDLSFSKEVFLRYFWIKMIEAQRESFLAHSAANIKQEVAHYL